MDEYGEKKPAGWGFLRLEDDEEEGGEEENEESVFEVFMDHFSVGGF